jgi:hypothetical protein
VCYIFISNYIEIIEPILESNGYVGIGTTSPTAPLTILGSGRDMIKLIPGGGQGRVYIASSIDYLDFIKTDANETFLAYLDISAKNGNFSGNATISGNVGIGTLNPDGALDVTSTTSALIVPRMTTTQRNSLSTVNGSIVYNTTTNQFNFYESGSWVTK